MNPRIPFWACSVFLGWLLIPIQAADEKEGDTKALSVASPDGKFIYRRQAEGGFGLVKAVDQEEVPMDETEAGGGPWKEVSCVWAPDSKHFAISFQAGARYEMTELYGWDGEKFRKLPSFEEKLRSVLEADMKAQLKKNKVPEKTYIRRIWDTFKTLKWLDNSTVEVLGSSERSFTPGESTDGGTDGVGSAFIFTVKYDKKKHPQITARREPPPEKKEK